MCPHCMRKWYKKTTERTDSTGNKYYSCECLICHQPFDMQQYWYNYYNKKKRYLGNEDEDIAELLIKKNICILCEKQVLKGGSKITTTKKECITEAEICHCKNPHCEIMFYIPKSLYDTVKNR